MHQMEETQGGIFRNLENIPTQTYIWLSLASILASAFFFLIGRRSTSLFIGQWAPTLGVFALMYKLLHPSREQTAEQIKETISEAQSRVTR